MKSLWLFLLLMNFSFFGQSKTELSNKSQISILTCAPGVNELYSYFGHSAIRVKDTQNHIDKVYNYGMFDFDTPNFYLNFCRGKLLYQVVGYDFKYFPSQYYKENRWIKSQILNLNQSEVQKVYDYLEWNILPENKKYHYDFFYDNCATKMYDVIEESIGKIKFDYSKFPLNKTHRNLIHSYLPKNSWSKFGIDLALGSVIDKKATFKQYMFLPDYTSLGIKNSSIKNKSTVLKENYLLPDYHLSVSKTSFLLSPFFICLMIFLITACLILFKFNKVIVLWLNTISITYGLIGLIILVLWFLTEHSTTKANLNILWANPLLLVYPFVKKELKRVFNYMGLIMLFSFVIVAITSFQVFDSSFYILAISILPIYLKKQLLSFKI